MITGSHFIGEGVAKDAKNITAEQIASPIESKN